MAYKRNLTTEEKNQLRAEKQQKMQEMKDKIEEGIKSFSDSKQYENFLKTMSKFHFYSFNNTILIMTQRPTAVHVASYTDWKNKFNRQVKKGEKGIAIFMPVIQKFEKIPEESDIEEKDEKTEVKKVVSYKIGHVFADDQVEQIQNKPVISLDLMTELGSTVKNYDKIKSILIEIAPVPVVFDDQMKKSGAKGYFSPSENKIVVKTGMSEAQTIKTIIHETAHSILHNDENIKKLEKKGIVFGRDDIETQAESVAFVVCDHLGLDTSDYSFPYLTSWTSGDIKIIEENFKYIQKASHTLINKIDNELEKDKEKSLENKTIQTKENNKKKQYTPAKTMLGKDMQSKTKSNDLKNKEINYEK